MSIDTTQEIIQDAWQRKNALFYLILIPLSWLFALLTAFRRWAYQCGVLKSYALPVPVIVVGNINLGGSGKTPVVMWLVNELKKNGYQPGVISRGYGGNVKWPTAVNAKTQAGIVGDEPVLIANRCTCPVWVGADRVHVATELLKSHPECNVIISDDGLQHYRLQRDVEIAVVRPDSLLTEHKHNQRLLPAGPLREPLERLETVDAIVCNGEICNGEKISDASYPMQLVGERFYNLADESLTATAAEFKHKTVTALAGIGNPAQFFEHLRVLGLNFAGVSFVDHHVFTAQDLTKIDCDVIIMTEKDAVKCKTFAQENCWVLPVEANIDRALMSLIISKLAKR